MKKLSKIIFIACAVLAFSTVATQNATAADDIDSIIKASAGMKDFGGLVASGQFTASQKVAPATAGAGFGVASVTAGTPVSGAPCYDCSSASPVNITIPAPLAFLVNGTAVQYAVQFETTTFTGTMPVQLYLLQGGKVIAKANYNFFGVPANSYAVVSFNGTVPSTTGALKVVGAVYGAGTVSHSITNLTIQ